MFLNEIPENMTYSILPFLRWQYSNGNYKSATVSNSIKITRFTSNDLLAETIADSVQSSLRKYNLADLDIDFFLMARPWLSADDFNLQISDLTQVLDQQIEK